MRATPTTYLSTAQAILDAAEQEGRALTSDERRRAGEALDRVRDIQDQKKLEQSIDRMNGSLNVSRAGNTFGDAVVNSGWDLKSNPSVVIPL